ncbi:restriction endonuclease subunit S [Turicimonas muris]|uniref:restriction endonuclease subunit S n=1 Tax=Turicimonas muris TaxID=1796652 RepID=UPI0033366E91
MENEFDVLMESFPKRKLRDFIEPINKRNSHLQYGPELIEGVNNLGEFVPTKAQIENVDMRPYKLVEKGDFVYNPSRLSIGSLAYRRNGKKCIVSHLYVVFRIKPGFSNVLLSEFLLLYFRRNEFNRMVDYHNYGSQRAEFGFKDIGEFKIPLPPIEVQRAYVKAYQGLTTLIEQNESLVKELEKTAQACIVECREKWPMVEIRPYLSSFERKNTDGRDLPFMGINRDKEIVPTTANTEDINPKKYLVLEKGELVFSGMQTGRDICIRIALSKFSSPVLLSPAYTTFKVKEEKGLLSEYLFLNFKSNEMDRLGWFKSDSSVRANLDWERFCEIKIPLPPIEVQRAIVALYRCAEEARKIASEAKELLKKACPAMVQRCSS